MEMQSVSNVEALKFYATWERRMAVREQERKTPPGIAEENMEPKRTDANFVDHQL
jgi:hypothetical protein